MIQQEAAANTSNVPLPLHQYRKRILLFYVIAATILGAIGTIIGFLQLLEISGYLPAYGIGLAEHPYLQMFGFLALFVGGVAEFLVPTMRGHVPTTGSIDFALLGAMILFQVLVFFANAVSSLTEVFLYLAFSILTLYSIRYAYLIFKAISQGSRKIDAGDYYLALSGLSLFASCIILFLDEGLHTEVFTVPLILLVLVGFVGSVILGIMIRTSPSSPAKYRLPFLNMSVVTAFIAVLTGFAVAVIGNSLYFFIPAVIFLIESVLFALAQFILAVSAKKPAKTNARKRLFSMRIVDFTRLSAVFSYSWLIIGLIIGVVYAVTPLRTVLEISFIHSIALGFIGSAIMGYAPLLLPGILSDSHPKIVISPVSLLFLNAGTFFMVASFVLEAYGYLYPVLFTLAGILIAVGIFWYLFDVHRHVNVDTEESVGFSDDW